jgi:hypothetical protein
MSAIFETMVGKEDHQRTIIGKTKHELPVK